MVFIGNRRSETNKVGCMCDVCAAHKEVVAASQQFRRSRGIDHRLEIFEFFNF